MHSGEAPPINDNASGPKRIVVDGMTAEQHPLPDQIEADRYLCAKEAVKKKRRGIRMTKLTAPGTT